MTKEQVKVGLIFKWDLKDLGTSGEANNICRVISVNDTGFVYETLHSDNDDFLDSPDEYDPTIEFDSAGFANYIIFLQGQDLENAMIQIEKAKKSKPVTLSAKLRQVLNSMTAKSPISAAILKPKSTTAEEVDYLTLHVDGIGFTPSGKDLITNDDGSWASKNRQIMKPAKLVKRILKSPDAFNDSQYELFNNLLKAQIGTYGDEEGKGLFPLEIVEGENLRWAYNENNYTNTLRDGNNLFASCMRYEKKMPFMDLYVKNPDKVKMLISKDADGRVVSRALLWFDGKDVFMDRVYSTDVMLERYRQEAINNGWYYKSKQTNDGLFNMYKGNMIDNKKVEIPITNISYGGNWPYADTMAFYNTETYTITNVEPRRVKYLNLRNQDGRFAIHNDDGLKLIDYGSWLCIATGKIYKDSDKVEKREVSYYSGNGKLIKGSCVPEFAVQLFDGTWMLKKNAKFSSRLGYWFNAIDHPQIFEYNNEFYHEDECGIYGGRIIPQFAIAEIKAKKEAETKGTAGGPIVF